jgi:auxin efflux carrier family protein
MLWGVRYHMGVLCDPIFWVVCWLLIGSPTAVQLTQITQLNCVFEGEMATVPPLYSLPSWGLMIQVLWWDYVVFCAPITMALVIGSLEVLGWAQRAALNT